MNRREKNIVLWRVLSSLLILMVVALGVFSLIRVIRLAPDGIILDSVALALAIFFPACQIFIILRGGKKESHLTDILFNTNNKVNHVFLVAAIVGTVFSVGLDLLSIIVLFTKEDITTTGVCALHVISTIATYLMVNCAIYYIYITLFRKKKLTIEDYAK